ncbi:hypothetical protein CF326_g4476 [Tilletia indica]|nr:hypothetical protein CF326_g4476 [Tilletia indica]
MSRRGRSAATPQSIDPSLLSATLPQPTSAPPIPTPPPPAQTTAPAAAPSPARKRRALRSSPQLLLSQQSQQPPAVEPSASTLDSSSNSFSPLPPRPFDQQHNRADSPVGPSGGNDWNQSGESAETGYEMSALDPELRSYASGGQLTGRAADGSGVGIEERSDEEGLSDYERQQRRRGTEDEQGRSEGPMAGASDDTGLSKKVAPKRKKGEGGGKVNVKGKGKAKGESKRHQWTKEERERLLNFMKGSRDLQQALLPGRSEADGGHTINHNVLLRACAEAIHPESVVLAPIQVRRQIESMDARYETALQLLSETGRSKSASEVPEHGFLRQERAQAIGKCWYFEDWHEMRRDRRSSAPARVRVSGGEGSVPVTKAGMRDQETQELGDSSDSDAEDDKNDYDSDSRKAKKAKTTKSSASTDTSAPAAGVSKRTHSSSTAVDDLASNMHDSMKKREARAFARDEREAEREGERNRLEQERINIARMDAETRRIEAETAREAQRQQSELMKAMLAKLDT